MAGWTVVLDDAAIAVGRTAFDLNTGPIRVDQAGISWGDAEISAFMVDQKIGSSPVDYRVPNRTITIPLFLGADDSGQEEVVRAQLQQKVSLLQREGGWLKRQREGGQAMYADIVDAILTLPDAFGETGGVEPGVVLTLTALPDFYGDEIVLDTISGTGHALSKLKLTGADATVEGDYPARCRLILTDTSGHDHDGAIWAFRSRNYDAASTAALFYEAGVMTGVNGAATATRTGASGGSTMKITGLPAGSWVAMLLTDVSGAQLTHQGTYRVWTRVYATDAGTQVQLAWSSGSLSAPTSNEAKTVPGTGQFYLVDLGMVRFDPSAAGVSKWQAVVQVSDPVAGGTFEIDTLMFQPVDEASGRDSAVTLASPGVIASTVTPDVTSSSFSDDASAGGVAWALTNGAYWRVRYTGGSANLLSHYLKVTSLGLAIPSTATVLGFQVAVQRRAQEANMVVDVTVQPLKAGVVAGTNKALTGATWPTSLETVTYGSDSDLWGTTWAFSDLNDPGFGIEIQAKTLKDLIYAYVYSVTFTVYYQLASGFTVAQDVVIAANHQCEIRTESAERYDPAATSWKNISLPLGDAPRLPPSGLEGRPVELLALLSRGDVGEDPMTSQDSALDPFTAQVIYRPCWLSRP